MPQRPFQQFLLPSFTRDILSSLPAIIISLTILALWISQLPKDDWVELVYTATANTSDADATEKLHTQVEALTTALASERAAASNEKAGLLWSVASEKERADALQRKLEVEKADFKKTLADQEAQAEEDLGDIAKLNADFADDIVAKDAQIKVLEERLAAAIALPAAAADSGVAEVEAAVRGKAAAEEALRANVLTLEEEAASLKAANSQLKAEVGLAESARAVLKQELADVTAELEEAKKTAAARANAGLESAQQELRAARGELKEVKENLEKSTAAVGQWHAYWKEADRCREENAQKLVACANDLERLRKGRDDAYHQAQEELRKKEQAERERDSEKAKREQRQRQIQENQRQADQQKRDLQKKLQEAEEYCRSKDSEIKGYLATIEELTMAPPEDMEVDPANPATASTPASVSRSDTMEVEPQTTPTPATSQSPSTPQTPSLHRTSRLGSSISSFQSQVSTARSASTSVSELSRAAEFRQRQIDDLNKRLNLQGDRIKELFAEIDEYQEERDALRQEKWENMRTISKLEKENQDLKNKTETVNAGVENEKEAFQRENRDNREKIWELSKEIQDLKDQIETAVDEADNEALVENAFLKDEIDELKQTVSEMEELKQLNRALSNQAEASSMSAMMYKEKADAAEAKVAQLQPPQEEAPGSPRKFAGVKRTAPQDQGVKKQNTHSKTNTNTSTETTTNTSTNTNTNPFANLLQPQQQQQGQIQQQQQQQGRIQQQQQGQIQPQWTQPATEEQSENTQEPEMSEEDVWKLIDRSMCE
ncbi:hypothetical protein G647_01069 [Cladophialophora carrionii CBS 160.54]|uniref:Uncharacterized protein n=1 Tax=Cladophialophora carrionii CBS 160.54 TaxID=1279043 RepID=V9DQM9_9EURO|nr:uncharacterized protein G647_01069 [Cladophialophora carrionii CBS 160.54]ETI28618.1 hypothetical protein G647_01069 [Cladophialophora carrionii CBS 160.54]